MPQYQIKQISNYVEGTSPFPSTVNYNSARDNIVQLGVQAKPGSLIVLNNADTTSSANRIRIGRTGLFEIDQTSGIRLHSVRVTNSNETDPGLIIIDILEEVNDEGVGV